MKYNHLLMSLMIVLMFACTKKDDNSDDLPINKSEAVLIATVLDISQQPVKEASVKIYSSLESWDKDTNQLADLKTDENGRFEFRTDAVNEPYYIWIEKDKQNNWPVGINYYKGMMSHDGLKTIYEETSITTLLVNGERNEKTITLEENIYKSLVRTTWKGSKVFDGTNGKNYNCNDNCSTIKLSKRLKFESFNPYLNYVCVASYWINKPELYTFSSGGSGGQIPDRNPHIVIRKSDQCGSNYANSDQKLYLDTSLKTIIIRGGWTPELKGYERYFFYNRIN